MLIKDASEKTVVVGMSGGVDSAVSALLLKRQGYQVVGLFMKNWDEVDESGTCTAEKDYEDVARVCHKIGIPYYSVEFIKEYWEQVFKGFLKDYEAGYTPNPDILCNREIKFSAFYEKAFEIGGDAMATGHYCQIDRGDDGVGPAARLIKGRDPGKDQSYFLYTVKSRTLENVLFPIGGLLKSEVRKIAMDADLPVSSKKDSTGICFIGKRDFKTFLSQYVQTKPGPFKSLDGEVLGKHEGIAFYTLGQRKGMGLGGPGEPLYVVAKDVRTNTVYVERGSKHPALFADSLTAVNASWVSGVEPTFPLECRAKVRYRQVEQDCRVERGIDGELEVSFTEPQRAITPGQSVVFYSDECCLGGAIIDTVGESYWARAHRNSDSFKSAKSAW